MKSAIVTIILLLSISISGLEAQSLSAKVGFNYSNINNINVLRLDPLLQRSLAIGMGISDSLSSRFSWNVDALYSVKGFRTKGAFVPDLGFFPDGFTNYRIHYVEILPSLEVHLNKYVSLLTGASAGLNLFETYNGELTESPTYKRIDLGLIAGIVLDIQRYSLKFLINQGLTNSSNVEFTDINGLPIGILETKNINFQGTLGIRIFDFDGYN